jgi:UDP-N-acetylmuramoyl-tripeptide--D-alanyl-D-alanine ligase
MDESTEIGVVEMGANHIGEIATLCEIASPTHGYITNFGKAHLEGFGSESGVIKGKSELYNYLKVRDGLIFANKDDTIQLKQIGSYKNIYTFSNYSRSSDLQLSKSLNQSFLKLEYDGFSIQSQLIGSYNFSNLAASILIARFFEVKNQIIKKGIESYSPENNRSQIIKKGSNTFILDAYNANPSSMLAALENFNQMKSKSKAIILGDMFELGIQSNFEHQALIDKVTSLNFSRVYFVGANFYELAPDLSNELFFETTESFQKKLKSLVFKDTLVLIKGSRGMALETLLEFF